MNHTKHYWLYVLSLEENKYYIGITSQTPEQRLKEHLGFRKTYWTEKYKPIEIIDRKFLGDLDIEAAKRYENLVTRRYMKLKGVNNVRGGDLTQTSNFVVRFGSIFEEDTWNALFTTSIMWMLTYVGLVYFYFN